MWVVASVLWIAAAGAYAVHANIAEREHANIVAEREAEEHTRPQKILSLQEFVYGTPASSPHSSQQFYERSDVRLWSLVVLPPLLIPLTLIVVVRTTRWVLDGK